MTENEQSGPNIDPAVVTDRLAAHVAECDECRTEPLPLDRLATALSGVAVGVDASALSQRVLAHLQPELERLAATVFRRRVSIAVLVSLLPLPGVLAYDAYVLQAAYALASTILPTALVAYLVLSYAAFLALLFALTYAAIPLLLAPTAVRPQRVSG